jgi:transposase
MSLIQNGNITGLDPYAYLKDVLELLPTRLNNRIDELLPHCRRLQALK